MASGGSLAFLLGAVLMTVAIVCTLFLKRPALQEGAPAKAG